MKILFCSPIFTKSKLAGSEYVLFSLAKFAAARGHQVAFVTSNSSNAISFFNPLAEKYLPAGSENCRGFRTYRLSTDWFCASSRYVFWKFCARFLNSEKKDRLFVYSRGPVLKDLERIIDDYSPDVIHTAPFPLTSTEQVIKIGKKCSIPVILHPFFHTNLDVYDNSYLFELCNSCYKVIVCTEHEKKFLLRKGVSSNVIEKISLGIDISEYENKPRENLRKTLSIDPGKKILLFAGSYNADKGYPDTLRAVWQLSQKRQDFILLTIGGNDTGLAFEEMLKKRGFLKNIGYVNCSSLKKKIFSNCDVFIMPSRAESFGIVYLEAWINKKPVIGARCGAVAEVIGNKQDGLLVNFGDQKQLLTAIEYLLDNPIRRQKFGVSGYQKVKDLYNWDKLAPKFIKLYETIK